MTASPLDSVDTYARLDPAGLYDRIAGLPAQIDEAWRAASALSLPGAYADVDQVVVLGMGGSAIGGSLLRALALELGARARVDVVRGYTLPAYAGIRTLVLASSNSGNTEEVVSAYGLAAEAGAKCVVIATGGRLLAAARARKSPALTFAWAGEPRSALGWSFASLLAICSRLGLVAVSHDDVSTAAGEMSDLVREIGRDVPEAVNPAKQLARRLMGALPVIVGAEALTPVAYRWRTQINENAKSWAAADELPEMNHNAPLGYGAPAALLPLLRVILLRHAAVHPRIARRVDLTCEQLRAAGVASETVEVTGSSVLTQMLRASHLGDLVSYYLGLLYGVDPSEMRALDWMKARLAAS